MSDISQSSQATIAQALTQLSQLTATSEAARQGVEVLVKHLAGNVLSLNKSSGLLNKPVLLDNPQIKGNLADGQTHQIKWSLESSPALEFFSSKSTKTSTVISLTEQQLQSLLRLPAKQLLPSSLQSNFDITSKLPSLSATILSILPKEQLSTAPSSQNDKLRSTLTPVEANNLKNTHQQNTLKIGLINQNPPVELSLPVKQLNQFTLGEKVSISITPKGNNWQLTVIHNQKDGLNTAQSGTGDNVQLRSRVATDSLGIGSAKITTPLVQQVLQSSLTATPNSHNSESKFPKDLTNVLIPKLAAPIIKASLQEANMAKPRYFELPIKPVLQQFSKNHPIQNQELLQKLQAMPIDKISLQIKPNGEFELLLQNIKPVASVTVSKELAQALTPLKLPNHQAVIKQFDLLTESNKQQQPNQAELPTRTQKSTAEVTLNTLADNKLKPIVPPIDGNKSLDFKVSMKDAESNLLAALQDKPMVQSVITPSLLANKSAQLNLVQSLLRIVQAKAETPAIPLQSVERALVDVEFFKGVTELPGKQLVEQVLQQIKQALPQGKEQDVNQIRQLITSPALNLSALQMINPISGQGFMSGLVTLLQMSLSARLSRNQSSRVEQITSTLNNVLSGSGGGKSKVNTRAMGEMAQLEQKHQLMREIGRLLSAHQTSKLSNAEQMIQGQENFYYNLPSALGGTFKDIELLIKREDNHKENSTDDEKSNKTWQLTMKLAVGELGELLTKAKLREDTLEINFYASNESVKIQVMNFLPLLRRKFDSLGIDVSKSHCQLGKIPDTLQQRPYHMFQAKA
jgi:hypothetical protein